MSRDKKECSVRAVADRLLKINWQPDDRRLRSHAALMREYLRRAALWAKALGCTEHWPFLDVAAQLAPDKHPPESIIEEVRRSLVQHHLPALMRDICKFSLNWAAVGNSSDAVTIARYALPPPYEPLIRMYERGGHFYAQHGFVYVLHIGIPTTAKGWQFYDRPTPVVQLKDDILDALDQPHRG